MRTQAKICGLKTEPALNAALEGMADYVGLVLFAPSPRHAGLEKAAALATIARSRTPDVRIVALTVGPEDDALREITRAVAPDYIQLHGDEPPDRVRQIRRLTGCKVIKAITVETQSDAEAALAYDGVADLILFDAKPPEGADRPGGHGAAFDWCALESVRQKLPFMLSGGLNPENVAAAIRLTGAQAVDASSGLETEPGDKDPELIRRFLHAVRTAKDVA